MISLIRTLSLKELFLIGFLISSQFFLAVFEPILLIMILGFVSSIAKNSSIINLDLFFFKLQISKEYFYTGFCIFATFKVLFSLFILYLQNYLSFFLAKKFSFKILERYHISSIDYLLGIPKTEKIRFILVEMETLAKSGFQNLFLIVAEFFVIISITGYIVLENDILDYKLLYLSPILLLIYFYSRIVKLKSRKLGNKRSLNDNLKMSLVTGLFQDVVLFKLVNLNYVKVKLNKLFNAGIKISAFQTTMEGSFKLLLELLIYITVLLVPLIINESYSFEKFSLTIILIMRLIPSISRVLSITSGFSYIKFIIVKLTNELNNER
jgi:hypothetical protein